MLSFLFQFFEELLQLLIFFLHSLDNSSIFIVDIHQIRYLSFIFGHKKLLRFNLLSELFFHWFRRIFVEYQASQYFFILEIFLFVILQQIFFSVQIIFNCLNFLLIFFSDAFVGVVFAMVFAAATASSSAMSFATASFKNFSAASRLFSSLSMHLLRIV